MSGESDSRFLCTSYVREQAQGPLWITSVQKGTLRVVSVLFNKESIRLRLAQGASLDDVVATLKTFQHTDTSIPIEDLKQIVWSDFSSKVVFSYKVGNSIKRVTTYITLAQDRDQFLSSIRDCVTTTVHCDDELASVLAVAWSRILGAVLAFVGTILFTLLWNPEQMAELQGGALILLLGRSGCALVGTTIFLVCCASAWYAIQKRSRYYTYTFGNTEAD